MTRLLPEQDWPNLAKCGRGQVNPDKLFLPGKEQNVTKKYCRDCVVKIECLANALDNKIEVGIWGGMSERERRALLKKHPRVKSWKNLFRRYLEKQEAVDAEA